MSAPAGRTLPQNVGRAAGLALLAATVVLDPPPGFAEAAWRTAGVTMLMAVAMQRWNLHKRIACNVVVRAGGRPRLLALAAIIQDSGLSHRVGESLTVLSGLPLAALVFAISLLLVFWTELNSNVAAAATFMPILGAIAAGTDYPVITLVAPAAMAASCGFMLPVGTPPNAIVYGTGRITMRQMMRAGFWVDVASVFVITAVIMLVSPWLH